MAAPMFERIVALGSVCAACEQAGRKFRDLSNKECTWPVTKHVVGSANGGEHLAQVCLICDQFPSSPYVTRRTRA